ncbi:MAG: SGNH/GDSL hydrolase family protein [Planctomycetes bacterium]|nr:SGNH/GDSL hydrolase family protein [Planctomycetota bacterium]
MPGDAATEPPGRIPVLRRLLFSALTLVLFALLLEGALALTGVGDPRMRLSLTRGFSPTASYFAPVPDKPGHVTTQMFNGESVEVVIPPRSDKVRVMLFGGSNTESFRVDWIRQPLQAALPEPGVEVFNLGRHGYGSERVRILFTQALEHDPDVVLIYMGHNEFIEQGFAAELIEQWRQPWMLKAVEKLSVLHTMNAAVDVAESLALGRATLTPEQQRGRGEATVFKTLTWERTQIFYEVYEKNLRAMVSLARDAGAKVVLCTLVGNDFDPPFVWNLPRDLPTETVQLVHRKRHQAATLIPFCLRRSLIQSSTSDPAVHLRPTDWGESITPAQLAERRAREPQNPAPPLRPLLGELAGQAFGQPSSDWLPPVYPLMATISKICARQLEPADRQALEHAATLLQEVLVLVPDHPATLFELGLVTYMLGGQDERARDLLVAAAHYDRAPTRANDIVNGIVREVAGELAGEPDVRFFDSERWFRERCPQGLIGYEVMMDNCHLHQGAREILVGNLVPLLEELAREAAEER